MRLALGLVALAWSLLACGSEPPAAIVDGGADTSIKPKDAGKDTGPPPYVPQGTRCVRAADAGAPRPWVLPANDGGAEGGSDGGDDGGADGGVLNPDLLRPPPVVSSDGTVASLPVFVPITFDGDPLRDELEDFIASVGCSSWWRATAASYGIADAISADPIHLAEVPAAALTDGQVRTWLSKKINSDPRFPRPGINVVYVIFYPTETVINMGGGQSCNSFGGYHNSTGVGGNDAPYAVIPRCSGLDFLTAVTSHELIEYATDPTPGVGGYPSVADEWVAWSLFGGSEVGDLCEHGREANYTPTDYPFAVQRSWSNEQAFLGNDPCVPPDGPVWFIGAPVLPDLVTVSYYGSNIKAHGLKLAVGASTTIDVVMQSNGASGGWTVTAQDLSLWMGSSAQLKFAFDKTSGKEGDVLHLTVTRTGTNGTYKADPFMLRSTKPNQEHLWFGVVGD